MTLTPVQFRLNGEEKAEFVPSGTTLIAMLREKIGITSPKIGCYQGACGACTVLVDGEPQVACLTLAETCEGKSIETVEGLPKGTEFHALQRAFMENYAAQCGFCTSGMLMSAKALLDKNPNPTREDVIDAICGNICRCTGYEPIINAILAAAGNRGPGRSSSRSA
ncbi:(2Fe-2S)-binding protein [Microbaculum marinum]|uniref:(2Fe-2S)-binding protein n=1 Tax=Microbaculum marinum TaxID=1764581 RepID=A0AAW9RRC1_9HYPH